MTKTVNVLAWMGGWAPKSPPLSKELLEINGCCGEGEWLVFRGRP